MQLDKTKGYIFRVGDVGQARSLIEVLVNQGYIFSNWIHHNLNRGVEKGILVNPEDNHVWNNPHISSKETYTWVDTEMFLKYNPLPEVKETIQVGDTIFNKEEFELAVSKLKGVKA